MRIFRRAEPFVRSSARTCHLLSRAGSRCLYWTARSGCSFALEAIWRRYVVVGENLLLLHRMGINKCQAGTNQVYFSRYE
jgi:hypothetical protein